jgi:hypothetical protein
MALQTASSSVAEALSVGVMIVKSGAAGDAMKFRRRIYQNHELILTRLNFVF